MINFQFPIFNQFSSNNGFHITRISKNAKRLKIFRSGGSGFTFIEIVIVIGVVLILFGVATINLAKIQRSSSVNATVQTLLADIKQQQLKSMVGATEGRSTSDSYGIYVESTKYTLFHGVSYNSSDATNFSVLLDPVMQMVTTLPSGLLVFSRKSGEVASFTSGSNTITVRNTTGTEQKVITINRYGVVTNIQ